jgi:hypothetical protein
MSNPEEPMKIYRATRDEAEFQIELTKNELGFRFFLIEICKHINRIIYKKGYKIDIDREQMVLHPSRHFTSFMRELSDLIPANPDDFVEFKQAGFVIETEEEQGE